MSAGAGPKRILVVEDDPSILLGVEMNLQAEGYLVGTAKDGAEGFELARDGTWDLIILDVMLPNLNGYEFLGSLRAQRLDTPVLMLSARTAEVDKIMGLDLGAMDYVTKPFSVPELLARVRAALRRTNHAPERWGFGSVVVDPDRRLLHKDGAVIALTSTEFDVLRVLMTSRGRALSREQIVAKVWGPTHHTSPRTVDNFIAQLRAKLEEDPTTPKHLLTVRGVGYRLED